MIRNFLVMLLVPVLLILCGCPKPADVAEAVIRQYDAALIKVFASGDAAPLKAVAGEKEVRKVGTLVEYKNIAGVVLESELLSLAMDSCDKKAADTMTATTTEHWRYFDLPLKPGTPAGKTLESEMKLKYYLKKENGIWRVDKVEGISTKTLPENK